MLSENDFIGIQHSMRENFERTATTNVLTGKLDKFRDLHEDMSWRIKHGDANIRRILYRTDKTRLGENQTQTFNNQNRYVRWFIEHMRRLESAIEEVCEILMKEEEKRLKRFHRVVMVYPPRPTLDGVVVDKTPFLPRPTLYGVIVEKKPFTEEDAVEAMVNGRSMKKEKGYRGQ